MLMVVVVGGTSTITKHLMDSDVSLKGWYVLSRSIFRSCSLIGVLGKMNVCR